MTTDYVSPALIPAVDRYMQLLARYAAPGEVLVDVLPRMRPEHRQEAAQLAACLEPVLGERLTRRAT